MRKTNNNRFPIQNNMSNGHKPVVLAPASPKPTPQPETKDFKEEPKEEIKMDVEEKKENINLEDVLEENSKHIDLDDSGKSKDKKKAYDLDDTVIRDITLAGEIHVRLISNTNGYFVDIRKYFKGLPTKKGIRMLATKFAIASDYLKNDLAELLPSK